MVQPVSHEKLSESLCLLSQNRQAPICFFRAGFAQLSQEAEVSVGMRSTDSECLSIRLLHKNEKRSFSVKLKKSAEKVLDVNDDMNNLLCRSTDYTVPEESLKHTPSEEKVVFKSKTALVKQLEKS